MSSAGSVVERPIAYPAPPRSQVMMRNILTCLCLLSPATVILAGQRPDTLTAAAVRPVTLPWRHALPLGARISAVTLDGKPLRCATRDTGADLHVDCVVAFGARADVAVHHTPGYQVLLPTPRRSAAS